MKGNIPIKYLSLICLVMAMLLQTATGWCATVTVVPPTGSRYVVNGGNFSGVAALDVTIRYDTATLSAPKVSQGSLANGTMFVANPNLAGQVRFAFVHVSGISGSGPLAEIVFTPVGSGTGKVTGVTASIYDANGAPLAVAAGIGSVQEPPSGIIVRPAPTDSSTTILSSGNGSGSDGPSEQRGSTSTLVGGAVGGTITLPSDPFGGSGTTKEQPRQPVAEVPPPAMLPPRGGEESVVSAATPAPVAREKRTLPAAPASVLERFRTYNGERSVAALKPLFSQLGGAWVVQEPAIALADGKAKVTVKITLDRVGAEAPSFALRGLEMSNLRTVGEAGWLIEAVPAKGGVQGTVSLLLDEAQAEVPVVLAPPLPAAWAGKRVTEAEANKFLAERGTEKAPLGDLNNDGKRDYRDDYIMIAHYLLGVAVDTAVGKDKAKEAAPGKALAVQQQAPAPPAATPAVSPAPPVPKGKGASPAKP